MTVEEIMNMEDKARRKLTQKELSSIVSYAAKKLNKRLNALSRRSDVVDWAIQNVNDSGGRFGAKGKNRNQLQKELSRMRDFYELKSSTVPGARRIFKKQESLVFGKVENPQNVAELSKKRKESISKQVFKAYRMFAESHASLRGNGSDKYIQFIGRMKVENKHARRSQLIKAAEKMFAEEYAKQQAAAEQVQSDFWKTVIEDTEK